MNKNVKGIIIVVVVLIVIAAIYFATKKLFGKKKLKDGYQKNAGEWIGCQTTDYDKDYYSTVNTSGSTVYVKKSDVRTEPGNAECGLRAVASKNLTVKYME